MKVEENFIRLFARYENKITLVTEKVILLLFVTAEDIETCTYLSTTNNNNIQ